MPRISSYPEDLLVSGDDKWVGSDADNGLVTKNFTPDSLAQYYIVNNTFGQNTYIFTQSSAAATWVISHNLDKFPSVTVVDSAGTVVVGNVQYNDNNQLTLTFNGGFSGKAYLN
jgi:hypothetical protein